MTFVGLTVSLHLSVVGIFQVRIMGAFAILRAVFYTEIDKYPRVH